MLKLPGQEHRRIYRIGGVGFLNARPLLCGLDRHENVSLTLAPPSGLLAGLESGEYDAALIPSIDYQRCGCPLQVLPGMAIGSAGEVLTVRVFSRQPLGQIRRLACDTDSHTSVALVQILWRQRFGQELELTDLPDSPTEHEAVLLIGDKVIPQLGRWEHELDLGSTWQDLTGEPFIYAFWALSERGQSPELVRILQRAYKDGKQQLDSIAADEGPQYGFEPALALKYLQHHLRFEFSQKQMNGVSRFYQLAHEYELIPEWKKLSLYKLSVRPASV